LVRSSKLEPRRGGDEKPYDASEAPRLYAAAGDRETELRPLWRLSRERTLFIGSLDHNAFHQHGAPVFLSSLDGPFGLRMAGGGWRVCEAAMIPAGGVHELSIGGEPLAVLYVEPEAGGGAELAPLLSDAEELDGALIGRSGVKRVARQLYEDRASLGWVDEALDDLLVFSRRAASRTADDRVSRTVRALVAAGGEGPSLATLARDAGLSISRLQHVFAAEVGVPISRYRAWTRMRRAIGAIVAGANFTAAAHEAGFFDQPHFAHDFRRTFGAPASRSLTKVRD
jgi:AraC-like DNA-binding protein